MYTGLRVQQILTKPEFSRQIFEKYLNVKYHENSSTVAELFRAGGWAEGQTDMTKVIVAFRNSANAPDTIRVSTLIKCVRVFCVCVCVCVCVLITACL